MRVKYIFLLFAASIMLAMLPLFVSHNSHANRHDLPIHIGQEAGEGDDEGSPLERYLWEQMRTADPATGRVPQNMRARELAFAATLPVHSPRNAAAHYKSAEGWQNRGPYNVGGRTRALAIDINDENTILAGGATGGMWRSTDGGQSWTKTTKLSSLMSVSCLAQDTRPGKTNTWYHGTGEYYGGYVISGDGIFKSTDGGLNWRSLSASSKPQSRQPMDYIWNIAVNPANTTQDEVLVAAYGGIYRSTNGGDSFNVTLGGSSSFGFISSATDIAVSPGGVMYATLSSDGAVTQRGVWRSTDGVNWVNITPAGWPASYGRVVIGIAASNQNVVYFLGNTPQYGFKGLSWDEKADWNSLWKYTYKSGDGSGTGGSWENRSANLPDYHQAKGDIFGDFSSQGGYDLLVRTKPGNENIVFIGGTNLYRSDDGFATNTKTTWMGGYNHAKSVVQDYTYTGHHPDQHNLIFLPSDSKVALSANDGGVYRTDNCMDTAIKWTSLNNGYMNSQFYAIALNHEPKLSQRYSDMILGGLQDNQSWSVPVNSDPQMPWNKWTRGDGGYCALADNDTATFMLTSRQLGKIYLNAFKDGNNLGTRRIDPIGGSDYIFISPFCLDANDANVLYTAAGGYVWRNDSLLSIPISNKHDSISRGWKKLTNSATPIGEVVTALASSRQPAHVLYFGTNRGKLYKMTNAHTGDPLKTDVSPPISGSYYISCIAVDPEDANKLMAVFSNYNAKSLFYSTDGGQNWTDVSGNLEENPNGLGNGPSCRSARIIHAPSGEDIYLVGTSTGLYMTNTLEGASIVWQQEGAESVGNTTVEMIDYRDSDGLLVAATYGSGVFSTHLYMLTNIPNSEQANEEGFKLYQNYPNPASAATRIGFSLGEACQVSLQLFDYAGKTVYTKGAEYLTTGEHYFDIPAGELAKGVYFYRVKAGSHIASKKMIVLK